jgi:hypothetical protein
MANPAEQAKWVERVLGFSLPPPPAAARKRPALLPVWVAAKDRVDGAIGKLQDELRSREDEALDAIVNFGLYGVTTGQSVALMAALRDADAAGTPEAYAKAVDAVVDFREYLEGAPIVGLLENNPFAPVPLRATLNPVLAALQKAASP